MNAILWDCNVRTFLISKHTDKQAQRQRNASIVQCKCGNVDLVVVTCTYMYTCGMATCQLQLCSLVPSSRELEEQAEDLQDMYDQRVQLLHQSMKKQFNGRKRRRPNDEEGTPCRCLKQICQR